MPPPQEVMRQRLKVRIKAIKQERPPKVWCHHRSNPLVISGAVYASLPGLA